MNWKQLLSSITSSVDEELRLRNAYLVTENQILRQQISGRVSLSDGDRQALAEIGQKLGRKALEEIATIAKANTILSWHRKFATQQCDGSKPRTSVGRPRIDQELVELVVRMAKENRSWGYDRIVGALTNLGYTISDQTVGNILKRSGIPPAPVRKKTRSWSEFIRIQLELLGATHFFTSTVWSRLMLVIFGLLVFVHVGRHPKHFTDVTASLMTWFSLRDAAVERWMRSVLKHVMLRLRGCGNAVGQSLHAAYEIHEHQEVLPRSSGKVILLPGVHPRPIRDGPRRHRPRLGEILRTEEREAA